MSTIASFRNKLSVLAELIDDPAITEIAVNRPREAWVLRQGQRFMTRVELPDLSLGLLESLSEVTAYYTGQESDRERPLLSATIPINLQDGVPDNERGGYRVMIVRPPVVQAQTMAMCIRKPALLELTLDDYERQGAFDRVNEPVVEEFSDDHLRELYRARQWKEFLRAAVLAGKRIMVSAGTNAGKTTLLNTLLSLVPESARIVTMEDAREIRVRQPNVVNMVFSRGNQGLARVTANELLETMMRLTPDVAVAGELRGAEAAPYLELLNSGHGCSISTIHADSPRLMFERLALMVMRAGSTLSRQQIIEYARSLIQVVVQFKRGNDGRRYITEMLYEGA